MSGCIFCQILSGEAPASVVYRDDTCNAFMDIQPVTSGHVLVMPNEHAANLAELAEEIGGQLFRVGQRIAAALRRSGLKCEGLNFFLADGEAAGQDVFHVHLHVIPRYKGDGFGFAFSPEYYELPNRRELDKVAQVIKDVMG